ncbi:uncharacterized protein LOC134221826 [Armigeres subalbatus]|uniref:uncharacterized protein LOC134221826 n=1 Tax=Armigeres subalbatus TaxID=124917 RepID=UPI002ED45A47
MEGVTDTETDVASSVIPSPPVKKARLRKPVNTARDVVKDLNYLVPQPSIILQEEATGSEVSVSQHPETQILVIDEGTSDQMSSVVYIPQLEQPTPDSNNEGITTVLNTILLNQSNILDNQMKMMQWMANMQTKQEYLMNVVLDGNSIGAAHNKQLEMMFKPISSSDELNKLEEDLKDPEVLQKYLTNMNFICGANGKGNGLDCCYKLIDYFMTREFLTECSWTGNCRVGEESKSNDTAVGEVSDTSKVALKFFKRTRTLFMKLILLADKDFTEIDCDAFFKRVMRNSKQRLTVKAMSKHKNRPKNLKYNTRKIEHGKDGHSKLDDENNDKEN